MDYDDKVFVFLQKLHPGEKINVSRFSDPERFIKCVKDLIDNWNVTDIEFNADYSQIRKIYPI